MGEIEEVIKVSDSTNIAVRFRSEQIAVRRIDLFIYDTKGVQPLEQHISLDSLEECIQIGSTAGEKIVVAIANSPKEFNLQSLAKFDSMQTIEFNYTEDLPEYPVAGGYSTTNGGNCLIELKSLFCQIILASISNTLDKYELLEHPRIRLKNISSHAKLLQSRSFYPEEFIDSCEWKVLPYDIGVYTQYPGTILYCYPDEASNGLLGITKSTLEFECSIFGKKCSFEIVLPPISRNSCHLVEITVDSKQKFFYKLNSRKWYLCEDYANDICNHTCL